MIYQLIYFSGTGGATYCAVASLRLMGFINDNVLCDNEEDPIIDVPSLLDWILRVLTDISGNIVATPSSILNGFRFFLMFWALMVCLSDDTS